jgi:hypothetical protein
VLLLQDSRLHHHTQQGLKAAFGLLTLPAKVSLTPDRPKEFGSFGKIRQLHLSDAEDDSSRRTGDITIYGMVTVHSSTAFVPHFTDLKKGII